MSLIYQLALIRIKGVGNALAKQLLNYCGSAEEVFRTSKHQLLQIPGIGDYLANAILHANTLHEAEQELLFVEKHKIQILFWNSSDYPEKLKDCIDAPLILYFKGKANLTNQRIVSIVGTRNATDYGRRVCHSFVEALKDYGVLVVSGLAYGIDSCAHKACVEHNIPTLGILGHGLDRIYPSSNRSLALEMIKNGGLLTEYPSNTKPDRQNFPSRNRIIAGLADVTVVVEAALKGGALITAEIANTYNRDVCAFPGSIYSEYSKGCNHLIKTHRANLINSAKDLEYLMNWEPVADRVVEQSPAVNLDALEQQVYNKVKNNSQIGIDNLLNQTGIPQSKLAISLLSLEMKGLIVALPGKIYRTP
ncbi:DNA-protecting protein DprA [Olivibacter sp. SDN3]|uniref:DNA-processing protein DprA n=1 Tax=Olivibacter sp. SDN3 TaxID=2764720 RepID=UPI001651229D|nr:DNA-processing protein DprA [Olivibacter sp. SDN3]QNL47788.1 DNA-protecting protein DprA [Olivibacter sp. SDN3]